MAKAMEQHTCSARAAKGPPQHNCSPGTCDSSSTSSFAQRKEPTAKGAHNRGWRAEGRDVHFWPRCCTSHCKTRATWNGALSTAVTSPIHCYKELTANLTACCSHTDSAFLSTLPSHRIRTLNFMRGKKTVQ